MQCCNSGLGALIHVHTYHRMQLDNMNSTLIICICGCGLVSCSGKIILLQLATTAKENNNVTVQPDCSEPFFFFFFFLTPCLPSMLQPQIWNNYYIPKKFVLSLEIENI